MTYQAERDRLLTALSEKDAGSDDYNNVIKQLSALNQAEGHQVRPEPIPDPEPTGPKAWFEKHSDALIRVGGTLTSVILIGFVESKFDVIFRSKASKYL